MRSSKSRSRGKQNRSRSIGNVANRVFDSSGPEGKVRGTPQQIIEKYNQLARDAQLSNDRVAAENFQQHAEHYMRLLSEVQKEMDARREQQERDNREKQAERDRDREHRSKDTDNVVADTVSDPAEAPQPDVFSFDADSDLVETPENETPPAPKKRTYKPRKKPEAASADGAAPAVSAAADAGETDGTSKSASDANAAE